MLITFGHPLKSEQISKQESFWNFYDNELSLMAENFGVKAKIISDILLQDDDIIKSANTTEMKIFKNFIADFQQDYPYLKSFKLYHPIIHNFEKAFTTDYFQKYITEGKQLDSEFKKLMELHFGKIMREYELKFKEYIKEKFLKQIDLNIRELTPQTKKQELKFLKFYEQLTTKCQDYKCLKINFELLVDVYEKPKDLLLKQTIKDFEQIVILSSISTQRTIKNMLKNEKLSQLSPENKDKILQDLNDFSKYFESSHDVLKFINSTKFLQLEYYIYNQKNVEDFKLLGQLFFSSLTSKFHSENMNYVKKLLSFGLPSVNENDIPKEMIPIVKYEIIKAYGLGTPF